MKTLPVQTFGKKYFQNLKSAPLVITAKGKYRWIVLEYSEELMQKLYPPTPSAGFIPKEDFQYRGMPIVNDLDAPSDKLYALNSHDHLFGMLTPKPSLLDRIKSILNRKVF